MKAYLANGLFSIGDRITNEMIAKSLRDTYKDLELYVPQENMEINDKSITVTSQMIAKADVEKLREADYLVAVIDGVEIDSGVAAEVGIAYEMGIPIFGLCTDIRAQKWVSEGFTGYLENPDLYRNLFVVGLIKESGGWVMNDITSLTREIGRYYEKDSEYIYDTNIIRRTMCDSE